jgi:hypothetical protein
MLGQHRALESVSRASAASQLDGLVSTETPPRCVLDERSAPETRAPELSPPRSRNARDRESTVSVRARFRWSRHAACRARLDLEWIDPSPAQAEQCRMVCDGCPVRQPCRMFALRNGEPWGIWGGLDPDERAAVARTDGYPTPQALPAHGTNSRYAKHGCRCSACRYAHTTYEQTRRARHQPPRG